MKTYLGYGYTDVTIDDDLYFKLVDELEDIASDIGAYSECEHCLEPNRTVEEGADALINELIKKLRRLRK
mgnify:FL=1|jgi:hypothetical protein|tara:strand:- start:1 stop:210 length:210 start_codon:yes stop_codon:yes gene_type:complete